MTVIHFLLAGPAKCYFVIINKAGDILNDSLCDSSFLILLDKCEEDLQKLKAKCTAKMNDGTAS